MMGPAMTSKISAPLQYQGFKTSDTDPDDSQIDVVQAHELDARTFWQKYVSQRRPVRIKGHLTDAGWKATAKWTNKYLKAAAGHAPLKVERRSGVDGSFGKGSKQAMTFGAFLDRMSAGDSTVYLTTQEVATSPEGHPELMGHPVIDLQEDLILRPQVAGNLVPQQINLWMGTTSSSTSGVSSGLHHDFHDNLYVLVRGCKRFRLYDPSQAPLMYTEGELRGIHPNGRIVYEGQGEIQADGTDAGDVAMWRERGAAETAVEDAELAVRLGKKGASRQLKVAEARLEAVLEQELDAAYEEGAMEDDYDNDDSDVPAKATSSDVHQDNENPPSFSKVDLSQPSKVISKRFPLFPGLAAATECLLEAGEMLYLPAGWFHEVTSFAGSDPHAIHEGHLAVNYWFHPPDNLDPTYDGFKKPYTSDYLPSLWRDRCLDGSGADRAEMAAEAGAGLTGAAARPASGLSFRTPTGSDDEEDDVEEEEPGGGAHGLQGAAGMRAPSGSGKMGRTHLTPAAGTQGGLKKRCRVGAAEQLAQALKGAEACSVEDEDPDYEPTEEDLAAEAEARGGQDDTLNPEQKQQMHDQIRALLMQGMLARSGGQAAARGRSAGRPQEFRLPMGRRHHAVMYCPKRSKG